VESILCRLVLFVMLRLAPLSTLFPYTTLFRSRDAERHVAPAALARVGRQHHVRWARDHRRLGIAHTYPLHTGSRVPAVIGRRPRSEEHTSELQSRSDLVCRLLLEKKKIAHKHL